MASNNHHHQYSEWEIPHKPFELETVLGFDSTKRLLNLTQNSSDVIVAAASGFVLNIYHEQSGNVHHLMGGHETDILQMDCDATGRFLVTTATGSCVVWDRKHSFKETPMAIRLIEYPFGRNGDISHVCLSSNAKYLILIGINHMKQNRLQMWSWSAGLDDPDFQCDLPSEFGQIRAVTFDPFSADAVFAVTIARNVLFGEWSPSSQNIDIFMKECVEKHSFSTTKFMPNSTAVSLMDYRNGAIWTKAIRNRKYCLQKVVKLSDQILKQIEFIDGMVVVLEDSGRFIFFDEQLKVVFIAVHDANIQFITFNLTKRVFRMADASTFDDNLVADSDDSIEVLFAENLSICTTVDTRPFIIRNFVALTNNSQVLYCDMIAKTTIELSVLESPSVITTFDVDPVKSTIVAGCANGRLFKYDYNRRKTCVFNYLKTSNGEINTKPLGAVLFTKCFNYVIGTIGNTIHLLDEKFLVDCVAPLMFGPATIDTLSLSNCGDFVACSDAEYRVILLMRQINQSGVVSLKLIGTRKEHCRPITSFLFVDSRRLLSFSRDQLFVEYDVAGSVQKGELLVLRSERFDQFSSPLCSIHLDNMEFGRTSEPCLIVCDSHFKCKLLHPDSLKILKTVLGPVLDEYPAQLMSFVPRLEGDANTYMVFATGGKVLGLQLLPFTGNSFKHIGMVAHSAGIQKMYPIPNSRLLITLGKNEHSMCMWSMNTAAADENCKRGGTGILPFCRALPGGREGWLFREMQALFYYMQIISSSIDSPEEKHVGNTIVMSEVADYLRALGFFPSEQQVMDILCELSNHMPQMAQHLPVCFGELLKVYVNHKPVNGYPLQMMYRTMDYLAGNHLEDPSNTPHGTKDEHRQEVEVDTNHLIDICSTRGEPMSRIECARYLRMLYQPHPVPLVSDNKNRASRTDDDILTDLLQHLPEIFPTQFFLTHIFGIEMTAGGECGGDKQMLYADVLDPGVLDEQLCNDVRRIDGGVNDE